MRQTLLRATCAALSLALSQARATPAFAQLPDPTGGKFDGTYIGESSLLGGNCAAAKNIRRDIRQGQMKWEISGMPITIFSLNRDGSFNGAIGTNQFDGQADATGFTATRRGASCSLRYNFKKIG